MRSLRAARNPKAVNEVSISSEIQKGPIWRAQNDSAGLYRC